MFNKNVGPCQLEFGGVNLGITQGGVQLTYNRTSMGTKADVTGDNDRERYITGSDVKAMAAITEATIEQLAKLVGGTVVGTVAGNKALTIASDVGKNLTDDADMLILKPLISGAVSVTAADWIYIPKAVIDPNFEPVAQVQQQKLWGFEANGLPVSAADVASGGRLFSTGSPNWVAGDLLRFGYSTS